MRLPSGLPPGRRANEENLDEVELSLLGYLVAFQSQRVRAATLRSEDFSTPARRAIFAAMCQMTLEHAEAWDGIVLARYLSSVAPVPPGHNSWLVAIAELLDEAVTHDDTADLYVKIIRNAAAKRVADSVLLEG